MLDHQCSVFQRQVQYRAATEIVHDAGAGHIQRCALRQLDVGHAALEIRVLRQRDMDKIARLAVLADSLYLAHAAADYKAPDQQRIIPAGRPVAAAVETQHGADKRQKQA